MVGFGMTGTIMIIHVDRPLTRTRPLAVGSESKISKYPDDTYMDGRRTFRTNITYAQTHEPLIPVLVLVLPWCLTATVKVNRLQNVTISCVVQGFRPSELNDEVSRNHHEEYDMYARRFQHQ